MIIEEIETQMDKAELNSKRQELQAKRARLLPEQRALLEQRLKGNLKDTQSSRFTRIERVPREGPLQITLREETHLQKRVALGAEPSEGTRNTFLCFRVTGPFSEAALQESLNELARHHEAFRTRFPLANGRPVRVIEPFVPVSLSVVDLLSNAETQRLPQVLEQFAKEWAKPFDLLNDLLWRVVLFRIAKDEYVLILVVDHFISDGWAMDLLKRDLWALYYGFSTNTPSVLKPLSIQFADFAHWERQELQGARLEELVSYWNKQLEGMGPIPEIRLPCENPVPRLTPCSPANMRSAIFSSDLTESIEQTCQRQDTTAQTFLMAGFVLLLYRYTGEGDIGMRFAVAKRHHPGTEEVIGWFADRLVLRTKVRGNDTFSALLHDVRNTLIEAYDHQDLPYYMIPGADRDLLSGLLYPTINFNMETQKTVELEPRAKTGEVRPETLRVIQLPKPDLGGPKLTDPGMTITVVKSDKLLVTASYEEYRYEPAAITAFLDNYGAILEAAVAHPEERLCDFRLPFK